MALLLSVCDRTNRVNTLHTGFPGSVEGIRLFRRMLDRAVRKLTAAEVDGLIESLSPKQEE
jgi:hypothetical protein